MTPPSPFQERLASARTLIAQCDEVFGILGVGWRDQAEAAAAEVHRLWNTTGSLLRLIQPERRWRTVAGQPGNERHAHLVAAVMSCRPCIHLSTRAPAPSVADLNHRLLLCRRCVQTRRRPVNDQRCEICDDDVADNHFHEVAIEVGYVLVVGNLGGCCAWLLEAEVAA